MPVGMITNVLALFIGGLLGGFLGKKISPELKTSLNNIFGFCAMAIGVTLIVKLSALSAVVLAVVLGTLLGEVLKLESRVDGLVCKAAPKLLKGKQVDEAFVNTFCAVAIIFCCSGTGWYGALTEGFTGDGSILLTKSILDFFTALIFAAVRGQGNVSPTGGIKVDGAQFFVGETIILAYRISKSINNGIARHIHTLGNPLGSQIGAILRGGCEMQLG